MLDHRTKDSTRNASMKPDDTNFHHESYCRKCKEPMNPDNTPTPRMNEVASDYVLDTPITSDLLEKLKRPSDGDGKDLITLCRELERDLDEKTNEIARLRELLNRAIEAAEEAIRLADIDYENDKFGKVTWLKGEVAEIEKEVRLAPSPEEPVTQENRITEPEWRELCEDEVIQEGDEYKCLGTWRRDSELKGMKVKHTGGKFRTRRPLPVQEERPLDVERIVQYCDEWADKFLKDHGKETYYARLGLLVDFATDLYRDEIQKLKEK